MLWMRRPDEDRHLYLMQCAPIRHDTRIYTRPKNSRPTANHSAQETASCARYSLHGAIKGPTWGRTLARCSFQWHKKFSDGSIFQPKNTAPVPRLDFEKPNLLRSRPSRRSTNVMPFPSISSWSEPGSVTGNTFAPSLIRRPMLGEQRSQSQKNSSLLDLEVRTLGSASSRNSLPSRR